MPPPVQPARYFEALFGFPEKDYASTRRLLLSLCTFETRQGRERCTFSFPNGDGTPAPTLSSGWHYTPSVAELRQEVSQRVALFEKEHPGYLARVREHFAKQPSSRQDDLAAAQAPVTRAGGLALRHVIGASGRQHLEFPGALFQAASQFNLLEFIASSVTPEEGIAGYVWDKTQGPDCALAAFAGTAYRNYLIHPDFVRVGRLTSDNHHSAPSTATATAAEPPAEMRGQQRDSQVDGLAAVTAFLTGAHTGRAGREDVGSVPFDAFYRIENGYFTAGDGGAVQGIIPRLEAIARHYGTPVDAVMDRMSDLLRIGVVEDTSVTNGLLTPHNGPAFLPSSSPFHTVWQTYNSALSLDGRLESRDGAAAAVPLLARCVLNGSYEATLLAGVHRTLRHLEEHCAGAAATPPLPPYLPPIFLTKVGGGVFHNDPVWISSAITRAMERVAVLGVPLDLRLVHFQQLDPQYL